MLRKISLKNFKAFGDDQVEIRCAPITLIYGPNSSGKSSILQSLLMLSQTFSNKYAGDLELVTNGERTDLGAYSSLIHKHETSRDLVLGLSIDGNVPPPKGLKPLSDDWYSELGGEFLFGFDSKAQKPKLKSFTYSSADSIKGPARIKLLREAYSVTSNPSFRLAKGFPTLASFYRFFEASLPTILEDMSRRFFRKEFLEGRRSRPKTSEYSEEMRKVTQHWLVKRRMGVNTSAQVSKARVNAIRRLFDVGWIESKRNHDEFEKKIRFTSEQSYLPSLASLIDVPEIVGARQIMWRSRLGAFREGDVNERIRFQLGEDESKVCQLASIFEDQFAAFAPRCERYLSSLIHVKPLRAAPTRFIDQTKEGDLTIDERFSDQINECLKSIGFPYRISVHRSPDPIFGNMQTVRLLDERLNTEVSLSDVGFGISQVLPILRAGIVAKFGLHEGRRPLQPRATVKKKTLVLVEQPEIHIHPKAQAELASFFAEIIRDQRVRSLTNSSSKTVSKEEQSTGEVQWIIETHSEALLLRLLKLIRRGVLHPQDISINYVSIDDAKRSARVTEIEVNEKGEFLTEWPNGFFEERLDEIFD